MERAIIQLPTVSYIACKGKCRNCKTNPIDLLILEVIVLADIFITLLCFNFSVVGVTVSFIVHEIIFVNVIIRNRKYLLINQRSFIQMIKL